MCVQTMLLKIDHGLFLVVTVYGATLDMTVVVNAVEQLPIGI